MRKAICVGLLAAFAAAQLPANAAAGTGYADYERARAFSGLSGGKVDLQQAFTHLRKAAEQGHVPAQVDLAFTYFNGNLQVHKDLSASLRWFRRAADNGSIVAQCMLGDFYKGGLGGVKKDAAEAIKWYSLTATQPHRCAPKSQYELYVSYQSGVGVRRDAEAAMMWLKKAAAAGNPQAQRELGLAYQNGTGIEKDPRLARMWLKKSREGVAPHDDHDHDDLHDGSPPHHKHDHKHDHDHDSKHAEPVCPAGMREQQRLKAGCS